ncbi:hypothetical protein QP938_08115 [Porticoccaceae bacterium LTM1]|nr:hypothetical protein QP938_08115 [Porticoccaceae bacterium LTM1]
MLKLFSLGLMLVLYIDTSNATEETKLIDCRSGDSVESEFFLDKDFVVEVSINEAILKMLAADVSAREEVLAYYIPDQLGYVEYEEKLKHYEKVNYVSQARCMANNYKEGDHVWRFKREREQQGIYQEGFLIKRGQLVIAFMIEKDVRI